MNNKLRLLVIGGKNLDDMIVLVDSELEEISTWPNDDELSLNVKDISWCFLKTYSKSRLTFQNSSE